jgi:hypothetical protein
MTQKNENTSAKELDKVKFIKLFIVNLVYAFSLNVGFVLRDGFSMLSIKQ